jgi:hypothetical protein
VQHIVRGDTPGVDRTEHRVAIVLDPDYGERVIALARECHVWLVHSALNDTAAATVWRDSSGYSLEEGITTFTPAETPQASFVVVLDLVEVHHGENEHDPPVSVLDVIGLEPSAAAIDELDAYGFRDIETSKNGFVARRALD